MNSVYLSLGSNIGNRLLYLQATIDRLANHNDISLLKESSVYKTSPVNMISCRNFYNMVICVSTTLDPFNLLDCLKNIEKDIGRKNKHNMPREIDIDIITYSKKIIQSNKLTIPHKLAKTRKFVLEPLKELDNNFKFPGEELSISDLIVNVKSDDMCEKLNYKFLESNINV